MERDAASLPEPSYGQHTQSAPNNGPHGGTAYMASTPVGLAGAIGKDGHRENNLKSEPEENGEETGQDDLKSRASESHEVVIPPPARTIRCRVCGDKEFPIETRGYHISHSWKCTLCNKAMDIRCREAHIAGKKHQRRVLRKPKAKATSAPAKQEAPTSPATPVGEDMDADLDIPSFIWPLPSDRGMMYQCDVCDGEIFPVEQLEHHSTVGWDCKACQETMHMESKSTHIATSKHRNRARKLGRASRGDKAEPSGKSSGGLLGRGGRS